MWERADPQVAAITVGQHVAKGHQAEAAQRVTDVSTDYVVRLYPPAATTSMAGSANDTDEATVQFYARFGLAGVALVLSVVLYCLLAGIGFTIGLIHNDDVVRALAAVVALTCGIAWYTFELPRTLDVLYKKHGLTR